MFWVYFFFGLMAGVSLLFFLSPVVATLDTKRGEFAVRWTPLFRMRAPWSGGLEGARIYLAGIPLRLPRFRRKPRLRKAREKKPSRVLEHLPRIFRFFRYCAADSYLRRAVMIAGGKLARESFRSFELSRWHAEVSLPDPALNGMLAGWAAAARWIAPARWADNPVGVNFMGRNWLTLEVRFYPYLMALAGGLFLFRLPHRAIFGHWLESKTS